VLWSVPGSYSDVVPAVPSSTGVADVFAHQDDGTVTAITLVATAGAGGGGVASPALPNQGTPIQPVLQAQDGSYVGTYYDLQTSKYDMVAFDAGGGVRWTVENEYPQIALADGGVIAWNNDAGTADTFDQNGNATGMMGELPWYSWYGDAYRAGSVDKFVAAPLHLAASWWGLFGGNHSGNYAAVNQQWFPELKSCTDKGGNCSARLAPRDFLWNAKNDLVNQLNNDTSCSKAAKEYVYDVLKVGGVMGFFKHSIVNLNFTEYLHATWHFYDGTTSTLDSKFMDNVGKNPAQTVSQVYFHPGSTTTAITQTPSYPLLTFWQPADATQSDGVGIDPTASGMNLLNESNLFHEALHGYTGYPDHRIQEEFHVVDPSVTVQDDSSNISEYIRKWVLSACPISKR